VAFAIIREGPGAAVVMVAVHGSLVVRDKKVVRASTKSENSFSYSRCPFLLCPWAQPSGQDRRQAAQQSSAREFVSSWRILQHQASDCCFILQRSRVPFRETTFSHRTRTAHGIITRMIRWKYSTNR
jgi:hypothetical protein